MDNQDTKNLISLVEERTGYRITLGTTDSVSGDAQMISAGKSHPFHLINISKKCVDYADYVVAVQCVMLLTMWNHPSGIPEFRINDEKYKNALRKVMNWKGISKLPSATAKSVSDQLVSGLLHQLRSTPSELLGIEYIYKNCPSLHKQQEILINRNLREYSAALSPQLKDFAPTNIWESNVMMSGSVARIWSDLTGSELALLPYKSAGFTDRISELINLYHQTEGTLGEKMTTVVDKWAEKLKLRTIYTWNFRSND